LKLKLLGSNQSAKGYNVKWKTTSKGRRPQNISATSGRILLKFET
jgi:hypothetical protein